MSLRQSLLKTFYPVLMAFGKTKDIQRNTTGVQPPVSFHSLHATDNKGNNINFEQFHGKKMLFVNTASDCGYTGQYADLEKLYKQYKKKISESRPYGSATVEQSIKTELRYFVLISGKWVRIKKIKELTDLLTDKKKEIQKFVEDKKLTKDIEANFEAVIAHNNSLSNH